MGFGQRWRNLISLMLASTSSRILLNGSPGNLFKHMRGLRQDDPLSPMLFILAMEPLQCLFEKATEQELISSLKLRVARIRASFYTDDAALFVNPMQEDISAVQQILRLFGDASGLKINVDKCVAYPVACEGINLANVLQNFGGAQGAFPCKYLGLPLGFKKPRKIELQPLFDRAAGRLKGWKGKLMNRKGRLALINSVITSTATYFLTVFPAERWMIKKFDKMRRNFLWAPDDEAKRRKCLVSWKKICAPTMYGGLGIKDLQAFSRALRLRWEWYRWVDQNRPWVGTETPCSQADRDLFSACTTISVGKGDTASFWADRWLHGQAPKQIAPLCFPLATRKKLTVKEALAEGKWMRGLQRMNTEAQLDQFVMMWDMLQSVILTNETDTISWHVAADGKYSASSAYAIQFLGRVRQPGLEQVWKICAEGKVNFFFWLLLQNRNWTAEKLRARGLPHNDRCSLCDQHFEMASHLALSCPFAKEVWANFQASNPAAVQLAASYTSVIEWWEKIRKVKKDEQKKREVTLSIYIIWHIWKERGRRIFQDEMMPALAVAGLIKADLELFWLAKGGPSTS